MAQNYGWVELVVFGTIALGFGFWQLYSINKEIARDKAAAEKSAAERAAAVKANEDADRN